MTWKPVTFVVDKDPDAKPPAQYFLTVHLNTMPDYPFHLGKHLFSLQEAKERKQNFEDALENYVDKRIGEKVIKLLQEPKLIKPRFILSQKENLERCGKGKNHDESSCTRWH